MSLNYTEAVDYLYDMKPVEAVKTALEICTGVWGQTLIIVLTSLALLIYKRSPTAAIIYFVVTGAFMLGDVIYNLHWLFFSVVAVALGIILFAFFEIS